MTTGIIKFFNHSKKFGFITPDDGGKDVYLPAGSVAATEADKLKTGQRVSFDRELDPRGEKATNLKVLNQEVARSSTPRQHIKFYLDSAISETDAIKEAVCATNHQVEVFDYARVPLTADQLKLLASSLNAAGQNIVRRYHPMFLELRLDDRFISEADYWGAVAEHPVLIDGPIVMAGTRASICKSLRDVESFFGDGSRVEAREKPKQISPRLAAMISGRPVMPRTKIELPPVVLSPNKSSPALTKTVAPQGTKAKAATEVKKEKRSAKKAAPKAKKAPAKKSISKAAKAKTKVAKKAKASITSKRRK